MKGLRWLLLSSVPKLTEKKITHTIRKQGKTPPQNYSNYSQYQRKKNVNVIGKDLVF